MLLFILPISFSACSPRYQSRSQDFFDAFDTIITLIAHTKTQQEFDEIYTKAKDRLIQLSQYYDIYADYDGIANIKTINDQAGIAPVKVPDEVLDLLEFAKNWYEKTDGKVNIAFGSVLKIWHDYREAADADHINPHIPSTEELEAANAHTDINAIQIDRSAGTVYITDPAVRIDVGAVAKGYAVEIVCRELQETGYDSFAISAGGNVKVMGPPLANDRDYWIIGVQNPQPDTSTDSGEGTVGTLQVQNTSVVTSGGYQRYFISGGKIYHHLIDPVTLFPADYYESVTIVSPDSGLCDLLSTAVFLMPYDQATAFLQEQDAVEALFVMPGGEIRTTDGLKNIFKAEN